MRLHGNRWHQKIYTAPSWECTLCELKSTSYSSQRGLYFHFEEAHSSRFTSAQLQIILRQSATKQRRAWNDCLLCCCAVEEEEVTGDARFPKRRKGDPARESAAGTSKTTEPNPHTRGFHYSDSSSDSDGSIESCGENRRRSESRSIAMHRHIGAHLQNLMLLTIRLASQSEGDNPDNDARSDSVNVDEEDSASQMDCSSESRDSILSWPESLAPAQDPGDAVEDELAIPDAAPDVNDIPRQYDDLEPENDGFLTELIESGAFQPWEVAPKRRGKRKWKLQRSVCISCCYAKTEVTHLAFPPSRLDPTDNMCAPGLVHTNASGNMFLM